MKTCRHTKLLAAALLALSTATVTAEDQGRAHAFRMGGDSPNEPTYIRELRFTELPFQPPIVVAQQWAVAFMAQPVCYGLVSYTSSAA
jgi:hypothetical protein